MLWLQDDTRVRKQDEKKKLSSFTECDLSCQTSPFREAGGRNAPVLLPAAVHRALFDSRCPRSDNAALDGGGAGSDEAKDHRSGAGRSTGAPGANLRFRWASSGARSARAHVHSSCTSEAAPASSTRSRASSAGRPYFSLRLLSASARACSAFFSARKRLRTRSGCVDGSSL